MMRRRTALKIAALLVSAACGFAGAAPLIPYNSPPPPLDPKPTVDPRTVTLLDEALAAETDSARKCALLADLGRCPSPAADAPVARAFADADALVRAAAARAALHRSPDLARAAIEKLTADASPAVRSEIARIAGQTGDDGRVADYVLDTDPAVAAAAVAGVCGPASEAAVIANFDRLPPRVQVTACGVLGRRKSSAAAARIAEALRSPRLALRVAAIDALAAMKAVTRTQIEEQSGHAAAVVRGAAARAAAALDDAGARHAISSRALADSDPAVRAAGAAAVGPIARSESIALLQQQLATDYVPLRHAARDALIAVAGNGALRDTVILRAAALLGDSSADRRIDGSYVLGALKSNSAITAHMALLKDPDWRVVAQAATSLAAIGDPSAAPALAATVDRALVYDAALDPAQTAARSTAGEQAILACVAMGYAEVLKSTRTLYLYKLSDPPTRIAALYALGVLGRGEEAAATLRSAVGLRADPEDSIDSIAMAIKAIGNAGLVSEKPLLESIRSDRDAPPPYVHAAHLALDRLNGTSTPFVPAIPTRDIDTSIRALTPAAR